jgi:hypothetical protein
MPPANPILQAASLTSINSPVPCRFLRRLQLLTRLYPSPWEGPSPQSRVPSCIPSSATPTHTKPSTFRAKRRAIMRSCRSHTQGLSRRGVRGLGRAAVLVSVPSLAEPVCARLVSQLIHAADFACSSGDAHRLIDAINTVNANGEADTITLTAGTYPRAEVDSTTDGPTGLPPATSPLTLTGAGAKAIIIEQAASAPPFRLFHVAATGTLTLEKLSITGGSLDDLGEGVGSFNAGRMLTISHSMIADNTEVLENGRGVIFNTNGTETITNGGLWTGGTGSARGKSAGTYRGAIGKTGRGTPLDLVLTAEGAPFEGRGCHRRQSTFARIFASITSAHTPE